MEGNSCEPSLSADEGGLDFLWSNIAKWVCFFNQSGESSSVHDLCVTFNSPLSFYEHLLHLTLLMCRSTQGSTESQWLNNCWKKMNENVLLQNHKHRRALYLYATNVREIERWQARNQLSHICMTRTQFNQTDIKPQPLHMTNTEMIYLLSRSKLRLLCLPCRRHTCPWHCQRECTSCSEELQPKMR